LRTVRALRGRHTDHEFLLVIGADLEAEIGSWYGAEELRRTVGFVVVGRTGFPGGTAVAMPAVSSTDVRDRLRRGAPVEDHLPRAVLDYIRQRALYEIPETTK
jgi:nicotinate-nucleotide adenylyltransferase